MALNTTTVLLDELAELAGGACAGVHVGVAVRRSKGPAFVAQHKPHLAAKHT